MNMRTRIRILTKSVRIHNTARERVYYLKLETRITTLLDRQKVRKGIQYILQYITCKALMAVDWNRISGMERLHTWDTKDKVKRAVLRIRYDFSDQDSAFDMILDHSLNQIFELHSNIFLRFFLIIYF